MPVEELPSLEVLEAKPSQWSEIFTEVGDLDGPLGDYRGDSVEMGSPLRELADTVKKSRTQAFKSRDGNQNLTPQAKIILAATDLQKKLITSIDRAHFNLIDNGFPPYLTGIAIEEFIEERDKERHDFYQEDGKRKQGIIDGLKGASGLEVPSHVLAAAYTDEAEHEDEGEPKPVSPELERQAYIEELEGQVQLNQLRIERLRFEWVSSMVIVQELRDNTGSSDILAMAS